MLKLFRYIVLFELHCFSSRRDSAS